MPTAVVLPKLGNSVESCIIVDWKKAPGDTVEAGESLVEVETDKATMEVESPASGTLLACFFEVGDEAPVLVNIGAIGAPGEAIDDLRPDIAIGAPPTAPTKPSTSSQEDPAVGALLAAPAVGVSPRARNLAARKGLDPTGLAGSGPHGRVIERDVEAALASQPRLSPVAKAMVEQGGFAAPAQGSGPRGRVMSRDLAADAEPIADEFEIIPVKGVRKVIAARMLESLQSTAQLTLNASADARSLLAYRQRLKQSDATLGLQRVTLNDLVLFAAARVLPQHPSLNALFVDDEIHRYRAVHLGFAVDTPRGLIVPMIRDADRLSLRDLAQESDRLATACIEGTVQPDEMAGGTFTITNLGSLGIESFTPVLNPPQVAILGVGNVNLKPVEVDGEVEFVPHIGLSLTINHQVVDGAPSARFLQALGQGLAELELLLAL